MVAVKKLAPESLGITPWAAGRLDGRRRQPALLFGRMHEDPLIEAGVFPPGCRVFAIASSGCTSFALAARGYRVTSVDINPAQIDYIRARLAGGPMRPGMADRSFDIGRRALSLLGIRRSRLEAFLMLDDPLEQVRVWRREICGPALRWALGLATSPRLLRLIYDRRFVAAMPADFGRVMEDRLARGFANHPNRGNAFAWRTWLACEPPVGDRAPIFGPRPAVPGAIPARRDLLPVPGLSQSPNPLDIGRPSTGSTLPVAPDQSPKSKARPGSIGLACADAADFLAAAPAGSFDALTLSNILDATPPAYAHRLFRAIRHAAAPGAVLVLRSFAEPATAAESAWAARDRAMLWGSIRVEPATSADVAPAAALRPGLDPPGNHDLFSADGWRRS